MHINLYVSDPGLCACLQVGYQGSICVARECVSTCWQLSLDVATAKHSSIAMRPYPSFSKVDVHTNVVQSPYGPEVRLCVYFSASESTRMHAQLPRAHVGSVSNAAGVAMSLWPCADERRDCHGGRLCLHFTPVWQAPATQHCHLCRVHCHRRHLGPSFGRRDGSSSQTQRHRQRRVGQV